MAESTARRDASPEAVVTLQGVSVAYGKAWALRDVTATLPAGAVGLLGPNGAGKSTMIKSAARASSRPTRGAMRGARPRRRRPSPLEIRARIGYMPENDAHIPGMNAVSFVAYCGELAGLPRVDAMQRAHEVLYYVGLGEARYRNVETYSTGMKQRIKLAQALVHDPDLLFLDEPTNGMDPKGRDEMLELIRDLAHNKGVNLILSSHLLPDVEYTLRSRRRDGQGPHRRPGADRRAEGPARPRLRDARQGRARPARRRPAAPPASNATRPTRTSCACSSPRGAAPRDVFALAAPRGPAGAAPARRACPRSKTCSPSAVGGRRTTMPIHDQGYRRYGGGKDAPRPGVVGHRPRRRSDDGCASGLFLALLLVVWVPFIVRVVQIYAVDQLRRRSRFWRPRAQTFREFLDPAEIFVFFITIYVGAGLIANDRRANALQIYLSKPLTRVEYVAGKLATLAVFLLGVTWVPAMLLLLVQVLFAGSFAFIREQPLPDAGDHGLRVPAGAAGGVHDAGAVVAVEEQRGSSPIMYAGLIFFTDAIFGDARSSW